MLDWTGQSRDEATGRTELKPVTAVIRSEGRELYGLTFLGERGHATRIEASDNHPFWVLGRGWVDSAKLERGMKISTYETGALTVVNVEDLKRKALTYNLTVADFHTFFAGESKAFVHNTCCSSAAKKAQIASLREGGEIQVSTVEEARELLKGMPELRPATQEKLLPNPDGRLGNGFGDARGTFRGDLINKADPTGPIHPGVQNPLHANYPHYNIRLPDGNKAAIPIMGR